MVFALRKGLLQGVIGLALLFIPASAARKLSNANDIANSSDPDVLEMNEYILSYNSHDWDDDKHEIGEESAVVKEEVKIKDKRKAQQQKETVHIEAEVLEAEEKDTPIEKVKDGNPIFPGLPNFENGGIFVYFHLFMKNVYPTRPAPKK